MSDTISTLERISDKLAQGVVDNVLTPDAANLKLPAYGPRSTQNLPKNRISVTGQRFCRASDQMAYNGSGQPFYNHRRGELVFEVVTQRAAQAEVGPDARHGLAIGRIRYLCSRIAQKLTPANVGGYELMDVIDLGDTWVYHDETDTDRTTLRFQIDLCVPSANYTDS